MPSALRTNMVLMEFLACLLSLSQMFAITGIPPSHTEAAHPPPPPATPTPGVQGERMRFREVKRLAQGTQLAGGI